MFSQSLTFRLDCERRGCLAANYRGGLVDEFVVLDGGDHEEGKVYAARDVAREDGVTNMPAPYGKAVALPFFEVAAADYGPPSVARKDPSACFHLIVDVSSVEHPPNPSGSLHNQLEGPRVHVLTIPPDVPATREDKARARAGIIKYSLRRSRRVLVNPPRDQHGKHPVAPFNRVLDHLTVVRCTGNDGDTPFEPVKFAHAAFPTNANHLVASIQRMLHHIPPELPRCTNNANLFHILPYSQ